MMANFFASSTTSPRTDSVRPLRRIRARRAARKSFEARGRDFSVCWRGEDVASWIARFMVAMVTFPAFACFCATFSPELLFLLGVKVNGSWDSEALASFSAISTARRQISRARLASPLTAATFRLANWMASGSTMWFGTLERRDWIMVWSCSCV